MVAVQRGQRVGDGGRAHPNGAEEVEARKRVAAALDGACHDRGEPPAILGVAGVVEQFDYRHSFPNLTIRQSAAPAMLVVHDGGKAVGSELLEGIDRKSV